MAKSPKWDDQGAPTGPEDATLEEYSAGEQPRSQEEKEYVHTPGTTHLNAYIAAVTEAEAKVRAAQGELSAAQEALRQKKIESGMI